MDCFAAGRNSLSRQETQSLLIYSTMHGSDGMVEVIPRLDSTGTWATGIDTVEAQADTVVSPSWVTQQGLAK
jgi:hypothetical protein